jgi:RNA polymerase sigma factor (sigma-70 family)
VDRFDELLAAARAGEAWALEALYRDLAPAVLGYLRGQGAAEPSDLASEAFVAVVRGLGRFRGGERDFRSWVFTIAHRRLLDERRRLSRRRERPVDPADLRGLGPGPDVRSAEDEALQGAQASPVVAALSRLTPDQRAVVLLRVLADLSVAEVAAVLGKREGAVKALLRRALAALGRAVSLEGVSG